MRFSTATTTIELLVEGGAIKQSAQTRYMRLRPLVRQRRRRHGLLPVIAVAHPLHLRSSVRLTRHVPLQGIPGFRCVPDRFTPDHLSNH